MCVISNATVSVAVSAPCSYRVQDSADYKAVVHSGGYGTCQRAFLYCPPFSVP
jgi:hypothetical protein